MSRLRRFGGGIWDFLLGDDWFAAGVVVIAIAATALLASAGAAAWWVMPLAVIVGLGTSLRRRL